MRPRSDCAAFLDNWMKTRQALLDGPAYFPALEPSGDQRAQVFASSPRQGNESVRLMYMFSMGVARRSILLSNAYFMPDDACLEMLEHAVARGVRVEIILPGKRIAAPVTRWVGFTGGC